MSFQNMKGQVITNSPNVLRIRAYRCSRFDTIPFTNSKRFTFTDTTENSNPKVTKRMYNLTLHTKDCKTTVTHQYNGGGTAAVVRPANTSV